MKARSLILKKIKYEPGKFNNFIKLNANERSKKNLIKVMSHIELNRYPDNDCKDLISKLSDYLFIEKSNITVGNGSSELRHVKKLDESIFKKMTYPSKYVLILISK